MNSSANNDDKLRLLVIEDDLENQKLIEIYLKRKFIINVCDSEDTFYDQINKNKFDIFLVDISLRGKKDGLQLVKELRSSVEYSNAPIICISAHVFPRDRRNAFNAGVDEFIARPVRNEDMLKSILDVYKTKTGKDVF
jgi:PleD family two-component response regulator